MNKDKIMDYLESNPSIALDVARDLNSWDGSFPQFDTWELSELVACMCTDHQSTLSFMDDIIFAAESGEFQNHNTDWDLVRYNELGRLEIRSVYELENEAIDYIEDIADKLEEEYPHNVDVYDDGLKELLDKDEELSYKAQIAKHAPKDPLDDFDEVESEAE